MDINQLNIFIDIMRRGSFAAVARDRGVDPATISRSIAALEETLKLRLFQRTTRKIEPTEAGKVYFERVEPIIEELRRAELSAADIGRKPQGVLRISCPVSFAELNITPLLPEFSRRYPDLSFELVLTDTVLDLITEHIDVAVRIGSLNDSSLIAHRLATMDMRVCASPEYLALHGRPKKPEDLKAHKCMMIALSGFNRHHIRFVDKKGRSKEVELQGFLRTTNAIALKQCALSHMGITMQATWLVGRELTSGALVDLFPHYKVTAYQKEFSAWALYPSRSYTPLKVRVFVDFLKEKFKHGAPWEQAA